MEKAGFENAPYEKKDISTTAVMTDVIAALFPVLLASGIVFGGRGLMLTGTCMITGLAADFICGLILKRKNSASDLSAVVTGMLVALCLPPTFSFGKAMLGTIIAVVAGKHLFGGFGKNILNPAALGFAALLLMFKNSFSTWPVPFYNESDVVTGATPLAKEIADYPSLFLGNVSGSIGETSAAAILIGGMFLIARKTISPITPVAFIGTVFGFSYLVGNDALYQVLSGGLMLGAFFMASDPVTTPMTKTGKLIFGIAAGVITCLFRLYSPFNEGVAFAILITDLLSRPIDMLVISLKKYSFAD